MGRQYLWHQAYECHSRYARVLNCAGHAPCCYSQALSVPCSCQEPVAKAAAAGPTSAKAPALPAAAKAVAAHP
jgi:hypothetical protein